MGSSSGCGRGLLIVGGCVVVLLICVVGLVVSSSLIWDRGSEPATDWLIGRIVDRAETDVSDRIEEARPDVSGSLETRRIESRREYLDTLHKHNREFAGAVEEIARLLTNPRLQDEQWSSDVAAQIAEIRRIEAEARAIEPPEGLERVHEHWVDSLGEFSDAMDSLSGGLDNLSPIQIITAIEAMERATRSFESMLREIDEAEE